MEIKVVPRNLTFYFILINSVMCTFRFKGFE